VFGVRITGGEIMKVQVKSADDAAEFIRERMLQTMRDSIRSMERCGCSQEDIRLMVAATLDDIATARIEVADAFAALTESLNDAPKVH
jgi:hypothetical protein